MEPVTERRWRIREYSAEAAAALAVSTAIPLPLARILAARGGVEPAEAPGYVLPELAALSDPFLLKGMAAAVSRIIRARLAGETVCIHGDYDVDGVTAVALLVGFFRAAGFKVCYVIPHRLEEGYGLSVDGVDEAARLGAGLLITVDCGISSRAEALYCRQLGIDLLITDHHTPGSTLPEALAVINPLQPGCSSPFKGLAGVGLAFKLAIAVRARMREAGLFNGGVEPNLRDFLDFAALGTIADLVPLLGENRVIAAFGLRQLSLSRRPGIIALKQVAGLDGTVTAGDVGFKLAPRLNAAGRLDDAKRGVELLLTEDPGVAALLAEELDAANRERQQIEREILADARQRLADDPALQRRTAIVMAAEGWHPGVIGIVASRLVELYHRPTILIALQNGSGRGSGRSVAGFNLYDALESCAPLLTKFGGHRQAAGLEVAGSELERFYDAFDRYAADHLSADDLLPEIAIDAVVSPAETATVLLAVREKMKPFGMGNPEPVFLLPGATVLQSRAVKEQHLKLRIRADGQVFDAIGFGLAARMPLPPVVDLVFAIEMNRWQGRETLQLRLRDIRGSNGGADGAH